jgi:hypothetical protein
VERILLVLMSTGAEAENCALLTVSLWTALLG